MNTAKNASRLGQRWRPVVLGPLAVSVVMLGACDVLLEVESPAAVEAGFLENPGNADLLVTSAIADFECAFGEYVAAGGLVGNELWDGQLAARMWSYDRRSIDSAEPVYSTFTCEDSDPGMYQTLSTARFAADFAADVVEAGTDIPNRTELLATSNAYGGYARLLLGEGMCSAAIDAGPELSSQQLFALAEERFSAALTGGSSDITNMALVGRARARLNQGNTTGALDDAMQVTPGFVRNATFSSASFRSSNRIWTLNNRDERVSVESAFHNLTFNGVADSRVTLVDVGRPAASDDLTPLWLQQKYPVQDSPIPIARYEEAQLIIAEIQGGTTAVDIVNALHLAAGLPNFDPAVDGAIEDHLPQERQRELFLESHHLFDKIRLGIPFTPDAGTPYQVTGSKGGFYGSTTCLPLPLVERDNNPNIP